MELSRPDSTRAVKVKPGTFVLVTGNRQETESFRVQGFRRPVGITKFRPKNLSVWTEKKKSRGTSKTVSKNPKNCP
jgi:hypothetical protein